MNTKKLAKLQSAANALREKGSIPANDLEGLAARLGRAKHKRGKEPTWVNETFPDLPPLSIPNHSKDVNRFTAKSILDQLQDDIDEHDASIKKCSRI